MGAGYTGEPETVNLYQCGGSLIAPGVVLTAAHCVDKFKQDPSEVKIRCGEWDTQQETEPRPHQDRQVAALEIPRESTLTSVRPPAGSTRPFPATTAVSSMSPLRISPRTSDTPATSVRSGWRTRSMNWRRRETELENLERFSKESLTDTLAVMDLESAGKSPMLPSSI